MNWMFLHCPQDGDVMLVWQPPQMGMAFASDGYIWADPEAAFTSEMRGYVRDLSTPTLSMSLIRLHVRRWKCTFNGVAIEHLMKQSQHIVDGVFD